MLHSWFTNPWAFALLSALPVLGLLALLAARRRRRVLARLGQLTTLAATAGKGRIRRWLRALAIFGGLIALVAGVAGPRWGRDSEVRLMPGRDLMVVSDVSRSMLAEDVRPNRLGRAKTALVELADLVQRRGGHRLGLVVFAAHGKVVCPLTHDYDYFREKVEEFDAAHLPADLRPGLDGPISGTRIGEGLQKAVEAHDARFHGYQDILLISDGDDPADDGEWAEGAKAARAAGIRVFTVGVGDPEVGGRIPFGEGFLRYEGQEVSSRLQEKPLEEIARRTGAEYVAARKEPLRLGDLFRERIEPGPAREVTDDALSIRRQRYPWFFGTAFLLLSIAMLIPAVRGRRVERQP